MILPSASSPEPKNKAIVAAIIASGTTSKALANKKEAHLDADDLIDMI